MFVLVTYDIAVSSDGGPKRLRRVARACKDWGQRVQFSVFECEVSREQWVRLRDGVLQEIDDEQDSVRFYILDSAARDRIEHHGVREPVDLGGPLVV